MFIVVIGTKASGKETVARYLTATLGVARLRLASGGAAAAKAEGTFASADEVLRFVTPRWRTHYVTTDITDPAALGRLWKRPFVLVVGVDAPAGLRYRRFCARAAAAQGLPLTLDEFVAADDDALYKSRAPGPAHDAPPQLASPVVPAVQGSGATLKRVLASANVSIENTFATVEELHAYLDAVDLMNGERLRPSWDTYFMLLSELASHRSNCMKRRVGCILVKDHQIIATGYNGTPKGVTNCNDGGCPRCNAGTPCGVSLDHCLCIHAEENALLEAGRGRVRSAQDVVLYCNTCPCLGCAKKIVQVGVRVVVYSKGYGMDDLTLKLFGEAGVAVRQHTPPVLSMGIAAP
ncbi:Deoxycytidine monophosphate (dCMP) deaminase [Coemansia nantahalensis]|uniref:Deoxycytidine monophosphate (dCMP) deaminase n=1 Tax=Coemansia nantahalensis TaxID=2789366 RepID=A0ACC1K0T1_9FUNG|nr:Deoxycytidine monophosphate (dCMP) deaminase [Coemansia nantahalensis]